MSPRQLEDWADLAEEQRWKVMRKPGGRYAFYPPAHSVPPELRVLNMIEHGDGHRGNDNNRALLKRAGLKFPEDIARERKQAVQQTNSPVRTQCEQAPAPTRPPRAEPTLDELIASARQDIVDSLSRLDEKLAKIQTTARANTAGYEKVRALAQALKEI